MPVHISLPDGTYGNWLPCVPACCNIDCAALVDTRSEASNPAWEAFLKMQLLLVSVSLLISASANCWWCLYDTVPHTCLEMMRYVTSKVWSLPLQARMSKFNDSSSMWERAKQEHDTSIDKVMKRDWINNPARLGEQLSSRPATAAQVSLICQMRVLRGP